MIIEEYDESLFISRFEDYGREGENKNFSCKGLRYLFEYLDESSDEENPYKLDVVALCCEFSEYKSLNSFLDDYDKFKEIWTNNIKEGMTEKELVDAIEEEINNETTLIKFDEDLDEGFIIAQF